METAICWPVMQVRPSNVMGSRCSLLLSAPSTWPRRGSYRLPGPLRCGSAAAAAPQAAAPGVYSCRSADETARSGLTLPYTEPSRE